VNSLTEQSLNAQAVAFSFQQKQMLKA